MAIQSASATFTRFFVPDPMTEDFWAFVDQQLKAGSFRELQEDEEKSKGFSSWDDLFDSTFEYASYHKGEYVAFNFRQDQRKVPPLVVKQHLRNSIREYMAENEGRRPGRHVYQQIREETHLSLLKKALPHPSACEIVWHPDKNWMLCGTTSAKTLDTFLEHFERNFNTYPVPLYHVHWATRMLKLAGSQRDALETLVPTQSSQALLDGKFLGYEFLTWIWFLIESTDGIVAIDDKKGAELALGERVVLSRTDDGKERVICTTQANALFEARAALQQGKQVEELQLFARIGNNDYLLTLDTDLWAIKGLKTPKQPPQQDDEDPDAGFLEKMYFLEEVFGLLDSLYGKFLSQRLGAGWQSDFLPPLKQWVLEGSSQSG